MILSNDDPSFVPSGNVYANTNTGNEQRIRKHAQFCVANASNEQITLAIDALVTKEEMKPLVRRVFAEEYRAVNPSTVDG